MQYAGDQISDQARGAQGPQDPRSEYPHLQRNDERHGRDGDADAAG